MNRDVITFTLIFIVMALAQVLIFNHVALFNVAVPFVFIFMIIRLPMGLSLNWLYTISFLLGLVIDVFSDTPGLNSLSSLLLAAAKRPAFYAYVMRDDKTADIIPSLTSMGWGNYCKYLITMTSIYCVLVFSIEFFSFASFKDIAIMAASSSALSFLLILAADSLTASGTNNKS